MLLDGAAGGVDGGADGLMAFLRGAEVLGAAVVALQAAEAEVLGGGNAFGEGDGFGAGCDAAAAGAGVDLDEGGEAGAGALGGGFEGDDVLGVVGPLSDALARARRQ